MFDFSNKKAPPSGEGEHLDSGGVSVLPRRLGLVTLTLLIVAWNAPMSAMAGFQQLSIAFGNGTGAPVSFIVAGVVLLLFAVGFVGMTHYVSNPGAFYCYIVDGLGRSAGLAGAFVATAAYILFAVGSYVYLGLIIVDMTTRLSGAPFGTWQLWSVVALVIITALGLLRIDLSMKLIGVLVVLECIAVALWELAIMIQGGPEGYSAQSFGIDSFRSGPVGIGVLFAMLTMIGFEGGACFRDETINPRKVVGRATYSAIAFMAVFYGIGSWAYIVTQGPSHAVDAAQNDPVGSFFNSVDTYLGNVFVDLFAIVLVTSQTAAIISIQGNGSRYLFALGRDRVIPARLASVHHRLKSPHVAVLTLSSVSLVALVAIVASRLDAVQSYATLTGAGIYFLLPLLIATCGAIVAFFRRNRDKDPGIWVGLIAPVVAGVCLTVLFVLVTLNMTILTVTVAGAVIAYVALALVIGAGLTLALFYKRTKPHVYARIGRSSIANDDAEAPARSGPR